jgi:predicted transcriptional regulator of viral defense system
LLSNQGRKEGGSVRFTTRTLIEQVEAEYAEMPGLSVTLSQAQRLWAVDRAACEEVFSRLISKGVLRRTTRGRFIRA